jgi:hypothetical protein
MAFYFWRVTGSPVKMPYQAYIEQYAASPAFFWQKKPPEPAFRHSVLREAHLSFLNEYKRFDTFGEALEFSFEKLRWLGTFYLGPLIFVPILGLPFLIRTRVRLPLFAVAAALGGILLTVSVQPHYGAPLTAFLVVLTLNALRYFEASRRFGNPIGDFLGPTAALVCVAYIAFSALLPHQKVVLAERPKVIDYLRRQDGKQLVIVRYSSDHALAEEWVYNAADIDGSKIVWARDMGPARNVELLRYYRDRKAWLFLPDSALTQLVPYNEPAPEPEAGHLGLVH